MTVYVEKIPRYLAVIYTLRDELKVMEFLKERNIRYLFEGVGEGKFWLDANYPCNHMLAKFEPTVEFLPDTYLVVTPERKLEFYDHREFWAKFEEDRSRG